MFNRKLSCVAWLLLSSMLACSDSPSGPETPNDVVAVELSPERATLVRGESVALVAVARDAQGRAITGRAVTWHTSDPAVARVDGAGHVTSHGLGTARITAVVTGRSTDATVEVLPAEPSDLEGEWRMSSFDDQRIPAAYAVFYDQPVNDRIVDRVEIRLDSATMRQHSNILYERRYCFSELHDDTIAFRYCWGDHGKVTVGTGTERGSIRLVSEYIQNLSAHGTVRSDVTLALVEPLWLGEAPRRTVWVRK